MQIATIKKIPLYNFLASGLNITKAVLSIVDCSEQVANGFKKDAEFLSNELIKHIEKLDPENTRVDLVLFDGASNVQNTGKILMEKYPRITSVHGADHVVSLFFSDFSKTNCGKCWARIYRHVYTWFGVSHHAPYALFMKYSKLINGRKIGLIRPAGTRMGGWWIAWSCVLRLKDVFESNFADQIYKRFNKNIVPPK